ERRRRREVRLRGEGPQLRLVGQSQDDLGIVVRKNGMNGKRGGVARQRPDRLLLTGEDDEWPVPRRDLRDPRHKRLLVRRWRSQIVSRGVTRPGRRCPPRGRKDPNA